jgi:hypothetical protein
MSFRRSFGPMCATLAVSPLLGGLALPSPVSWRARAATSTDTDYASGLLVWRKPGATPDHAACASCHGPDGLELASYAFGDADILRRARVHLDDIDSQRIVGFIHRVRARYGIQAPKDPMEDRPLQPGGRVLPGKTPADRDIAFGKELSARIPGLFRGRIATVDQAKAAAKALLDLDPWALLIGIPMNRLSEDVAHGSEHASIAQWLPEVMPGIPDHDRLGWFAAQDRYLADPTIESLRSLISLHEQLTSHTAVPGIASISNFKYRALLLLDYRLRTRAPLAPQPSVGPEIVPPGLPNPVWEVGDLARTLEMQSPATLGFGADLDTKKLAGPGLGDQLHELSLSWLWLGWLLDQGMYHSRAGKAGVRGDWLARALWLYGPYPIHNIYSATRRQLVASLDPKGWPGDPGFRHLFWDYAAVRIGHRYVNQVPSDPEQRRLYLTFTCNCFRMNLLLLKDELQRTRTVWVRTNSAQNVRDLTDFLVRFDPGSKEKTEQLREELLGLIQKADERI